MSREFKFRAWDKNHKNSNEIRIKKCGMIYFDFEEYACDHDGEVGNFNVDVETMPIMQYTGLKDKNGKMIFEMDFVRSGNGRIWAVRFGEFIYTYPRQTIKGYGFYIQPLEEELKETGNGYLCDGLEVIGNTYESDLLEPKKESE